MSFAHDSLSVSGESTHRLMASSVSLPLGLTLLLSIGSLPLPTPGPKTG